MRGEEREPYLVDLSEMKEELQEVWDRLHKLLCNDVMSGAHEVEVGEALDHINKAMLNLWNCEV
jgi:uncharacterized protein YqiB (DUF1249 family)